MQPVILAGGKNSRLGKLSTFPKLIIPFCKDGKTTTVLKYYSDFFRNLTVIIHEQYYRMVENYIRSNNINNVNLVISTVQTGSYDTIMSVYDKLPKNDVLFIWSDLIVDCNEFRETPVSNTIYIKDGKFRCYADGLKVTSVDNNSGNVPGVYFIKYLKQLKRLSASDLAFAFNHIGFNTVRLNSSIVELRDFNTYCNFTIGTSVLTRTFNSINFIGDIVLKTSNKQYKHLIDDENVWYRKAKQLKLRDFIPKRYFKFGRTLCLEYLKRPYRPLASYASDTYDCWIDFDSLFKTISDLHNSDTVSVSFETYYTDSKIEIVDKTLKRISSIAEMLVSDVDLNLPGKLQSVLDIVVSKYYKEQDNYGFFHGDLNGSNVLYDGNSSFKFLDPRGYFGNTKLYGPMWYERAKVLYMCSGYDAFNKYFDYLYYSSDDYVAPKPIFASYSPELSAIDYMLLGVIYLSLTSYICDNIFKVNIAYEHGLKLLNKGLKLYEEEKSKNESI